MEIEEAIRLKMVANAGLSALVGSRIYPQQGQQSEDADRILYQASDSVQQFAVKGPMNHYLIQMRFDCYAIRSEGYPTVKAIAAALKLPAADGGPLLGFRGLIGSGAFYVKGVFDGASDDEFEPPLHAEEPGIDYVSVGMRIYYSKRS